MTNEQQMEAALIENLQRQDSDPIEEASAIRSLMDECGYTQEQAARKLGKSRPPSQTPCAFSPCPSRC